MSDPGWLSILPPIVAIVLAIRTRQVHLSLFIGILMGAWILAGFNPLTGIAGGVRVLYEVVVAPSNARTLIFTLVVGSLILLVQRSGGVAGFAEWMIDRGWVRGPASAQVISALLGMSIFIESNITCLVTGTVSRPLYDRVGLSRAKLAYVCDSTSAPICMLIPINAWGALLLTLIAAEGIGDPVAALAAAIPFNFYAILALAMVFWISISGRDFGPMARAEKAARVRSGSSGGGGELDPDAPAAGRKPSNLIIPILVMVATVPIVLYITGDGEWTQGSGSTAVLTGVSLAVAVAMVMYRFQGLFGWGAMGATAVRGARDLLPIAAILGLAIGLGEICRDLETGAWVAGTVAPFLTPATVAPLVFLTGCVIAFSTGSSWGTFAILMPIAVPLALQSGAPVSLSLGAVMGGGIFGDHCSPISDTTVVSSLSAGCDHIEHVTTQIPYALVAGIGATLLYFVAGLLI